MRNAVEEPQGHCGEAQRTGGDYHKETENATKQLLGWGLTGDGSSVGKGTGSLRGQNGTNQQARSKAGRVRPSLQGQRHPEGKGRGCRASGPTVQSPAPS